ncbi:hypothetical protein BHE86_00150 [Shigella sp. FC1655]|nr:hypothetical protein BGK50_00150 [Shigella sp. FC130]OEI94292.1 hypothetical protein BHE86_00150 [Shigella sp. FC1655]OEJ08109.1 hypothetical protein BHE89_14035 [Shigella sp. FC1967]
MLCAGAWINLVQAFCKYQKEKSPGKYIVYIHRGGLKHENLILPPYKGAVKKMNKYSLIRVIVISINITLLLITLFYNNPIENFTIQSEYINVQVKFINNKH